MNKTMVLNATNEIIKDYKEGFLEKVEAKNRLEGIITLINHSDIESSSERFALKKEVMEKWNSNKLD